MEGPFKLTKEQLALEVTKTSPGTFILADEPGKVEYVGRADEDLRIDLLNWIGEYDHFQFEYAKTALEAFEKECVLWHRHGGPLGKVEPTDHPDRPDGSGWQCPSCLVFG